MNQNGSIQTTFNPLTGTFTTFRNIRNEHGDVITHVANTGRASTTIETSPADNDGINIQRQAQNSISICYNPLTSRYGEEHNRGESYEMNQVNQDTNSPPLVPDLTSTSVGSDGDDHVANGGISVAPLAGSNIRMYGSRFNRPGRRQLSPSERFKDVLERSSSIFHMLTETWTTTDDKMKVTQVCYENHSFAIFTSLLSKNTSVGLVSGGQQNVPFGGILWQTSTSPPKAITITAWYESNPEGSDEVMSACCSCNPTITRRRPHRSACDHLNVFLDRTGVYDLFQSVIRDQHVCTRVTRYFGNPISQTQLYPIVKMVRTQRQDICNGFRQDWSFYVQFDYERKLFVSLVLIKSKKIQCQLCRGHHSRRGQCIHEVCFEKACTTDDVGVEVFDQNDSDIDDEEIDQDLFDDVNQNNRSRGDSQTGTERKDPVEDGKYCTHHVKLPLLPCDGIRAQSFFMATKLEELKEGETLKIEDLYGVCRFCNYKRNQVSLVQTGSSFRKTKLYTLNQQVPIVEVEDWKCPRCGAMVMFTGAGRSLFPIRRTYLYTYELLYFFVHNVCRLGHSFRSQYDSYHMIQVSESARARFDNFYASRGVLQYDPDDCNSGRRRAAEAFRTFIKLIDINNSTLCNSLFSCNHCERPLTQSEKILHGISDNDATEYKKFIGLAIDGTSAGILHNLPNYSREVKELTVRSALYRNKRVITNVQFSKAIKTLVKIVRSRIRTVVSGKRVITSEDGILKFVLPLADSEEGPASKSEMRLSKTSMACLLLIFLKTDCVCSSSATTFNHRATERVAHTKQCIKLRKTFNKCLRNTKVLSFINGFMSITNDVMNTSDLLEGDNDSDFHSSDDEEEENGNGHESLSDDDSLNNIESSQNRGYNSGRRWFLTVSIPYTSRCGQLLESYLDLISMLLFDNVVYPYIRPGVSVIEELYIPNDQGFSIDERHTELFNANGSLKLESSVIGRDSILAHEEYIRRIVNYLSICRGQRITQTNNNHLQHRMSLIQINSLLAKLNPSFSRFLEQVLLHEHIVGDHSKRIMELYSSSIEEHLENAKQYFSWIIQHLTPECKEYWKTYSGCQLPSLQSTLASNDNSEDLARRAGSSFQSISSNAAISGMSFPGRQQVRPLLTFDNKEAKQCGKRYPNNSSHSPGLLCVLCPCSNPKVIGFIIMTRAESTALALSAILMYFVIPPSVVFYDNGCNTVDAALLRIPWLLLFIFIVVDRFHYKIHTCSDIFNADMYRQLDDLKTSVVEAINAIIKRALYNMRFLKGDVLVHYLNIRFALLNLNAKYYEIHGRRDIEDVDLNKFYSSLHECNCPASEFQLLIEKVIEEENEKRERAHDVD